MIGSFDKFPIVNFFKKIQYTNFCYWRYTCCFFRRIILWKWQKFKDFFYITVSTGIGGSAIINKKVLNSDKKIVGQIGHTVIKYNGKICGCGRNGCLEAYSSGTAIEKKINKKLKLNLKLKEIIKEHIKNKFVIKSLDEAALALSESIINIHNILGIKNFIIGEV